MRRLIFAILLAGCGNVPDKGSDMSAGGDMSTSGGDGGGGSCTAGQPCQTGTGDGLCMGGTCSTCVDTTDDAACATVYGAGTICLNGACASGCRSASDCNGQPCTNHQCGSATCAGDGDCDPSQVCNTTSHTCVASASTCGATTAGVCPINPADFCCSPSTTCTAGNCCGTGACTVTTANDGTCKPINGGPAGNCVLNSCAAPTGNTRYVDFAAPSGGSGSMSCPYNTLATALNDGALVSSGGTIIVKGGQSNTSGGHAIPAGINITGSDSSFAACTVATCADATKWPVLTSGTVNPGFTFKTAGTRKVSFFTLQGAGAGATNYGIYASAATVSLDHVQVSGFYHGIKADVGSSITVGSGVSSTMNNHAGVVIADGGASAGGSVDVENVGGDRAVTFNSNATFGLYCEGNGVLKINAPVFTSGAGTQQVFASSNGSAGVRFYSTTATKITGLIAEGNGKDSTQSYYDGLVIFAKSQIKVRGSRFAGNAGSGIHVVANGTNTANGLSNIDLGANYQTDPGANAFVTNTNAGLCVDSGPAGNATNKSLAAEGNLFGTNNCATTVATLSRSTICYGGVDISAACSGALDIAECVGGACQ